MIEMVTKGVKALQKSQTVRKAVGDRQRGEEHRMDGASSKE